MIWIDLGDPPPRPERAVHRPEALLRDLGQLDQQRDSLGRAPLRAALQTVGQRRDVARPLALVAQPLQSFGVGLAGEGAHHELHRPLAPCRQLLERARRVEEPRLAAPVGRVAEALEPHCDGRLPPRSGPIRDEWLVKHLEKWLVDVRLDETVEGEVVAASLLGELGGEHAQRSPPVGISTFARLARQLVNGQLDVSVRGTPLSEQPLVFEGLEARGEQEPAYRRLVRTPGERGRADHGMCVVGVGGDLGEQDVGRGITVLVGGFAQSLARLGASSASLGQPRLGQQGRSALVLRCGRCRGRRVRLGEVELADRAAEHRRRP